MKLKKNIKSNLIFIIFAIVIFMVSKLIFAAPTAIPKNLPELKLVGKGSGATREEATNKAMANLSNKIEVNIKSKQKVVTTETDDSYEYEDRSEITLSSDIPLIGVGIKADKNFWLRRYSVTATLTQKNIPLYIDRVKELDKEIYEKYRLTYSKKIERNSEKKKILGEAFELFATRLKYSHVIKVLGGNINKPVVSQNKLAERDIELMKKLNQTVIIDLNIKGHIDEKHKKELYKSFVSSVTKKNIILTSDLDKNNKVDRSKNTDKKLIANIYISDTEVSVEPETKVFPKRTTVSVNAFIAIKTPRPITKVLFKENLNTNHTKIELDDAVRGIIKELTDKFKVTIYDTVDKL